MRVKQIMSQPVLTVREDATLEEVATLMLQHRISGVPVVNDSGAVVGIVTEWGFTAKEKRLPFAMVSFPQLFKQYLDQGEVDAIYQSARTLTAREILSTNVLTVTEDDLVRTVLERLLQRHVYHILVVRDGLPIGIVTRHDLLKVMLAEPAAPIAKVE